MTMTGTITMSMREIDRLKIIQAIVDGNLKPIRFGRALFELNIESICANSSQAKGRVERANLTFAGLPCKGITAAKYLNDGCRKFLCTLLYR